MLEHLQTIAGRLESIDTNLADLTAMARLLLHHAMRTPAEAMPAGKLEPVPSIPVEEKTIYRSAAYTMERVGISESTLLRCQQRGEITVAMKDKKKKYYLDADVERLRKSYRDR